MIAPSPQPEDGKRFVIETDRPLGDSLIWQLQRAYYATRGIEAWRRGEVPHYVTSNPSIADSYAEIVFAFWRDRRRLAPHDGEPLTLLEIGAGSGRFAFHFLRRLGALCAEAGVPSQAFRYVLSDAAEANLDFWRHHPGFESFFADRRLDLAHVDLAHVDLAHADPAQPESLALQMSGGSIGPGSLRHPLVVIANYVFDSIPQDLFRIEDRRAYAARVSLAVDEDPAALDPGALLARLQMHCQYEEVMQPPYAEAWLQRLFDEYRHDLRGAHLLFPAAGLRALRRLAALSRAGLLVLTADKGEHRLAALEGRAQLNVARHGSISLPVNYHAFTRVCVQDGGLALVPSRAHASIAVIGLLALPDAGRHEETQRAYRLHVGDFGPDDFYSIARHARDTTARMSAADILAYLRLSRHDSRQLEQHLPRLMELASELDAPMRENLIEAVEEVWDMYFPLGEAFDLANGIARLLHTMDDCERALIFYERSMAIYGPDTGTLCNIAACYRRLGEGARAAAVLHKVLEYDPGNAAATALLASADR